MSSELLIRHANYGLELSDALTGGPLLGKSSVAAEVLVVPLSGVKTNVEPFLVNRSRWVFEDLETDVRISVAADFYLTTVFETGSGSVPAVPATGNGLLVRVEMIPRTGYPFAANLTRVVGVVRLASSVDPNQPRLPGATVTVTPYYGNPPVAGPGVTTATADDGQYVMWFLPDPDQSEPLPSSFDAEASAELVIHGVPITVSGSIENQSLTGHQVNGADPIELVET